MSKRPDQIGVTGGIGAGKSTVCEIFKTLNIPVYNADDRAKWLMNNEEELKEDIIAEFSEKAYNEEGLDRQYLAANVFQDQRKLSILNNLVHPMVAYDYHEWVMEHQESPYLIKEAALMFEAGSHREMDKTVLVIAPEEVRIARVLKRDPERGEEQIKDIISKQIPVEKALEIADHMIRNDEQTLLLPKVLELHKLFSGATG
jgi:dephospho-CoA kinase